MYTTFVPTDEKGHSYTIVTHVILPEKSFDRSSQHVSQKFSRAKDKIKEIITSAYARFMMYIKDQKELAALQIFFGMLTNLFNIVLAVHRNSVTDCNYVACYGSYIYIGAGSMSLAAKGLQNPILEKGALGLNVLSVLTTIAVLLLCSCTDRFSVLILSLLQLLVSIYLTRCGFNSVHCNKLKCNKISVFHNQENRSWPKLFPAHNEQDVFVIGNPNSTYTLYGSNVDPPLKSVLTAVFPNVKSNV